MRAHAEQSRAAGGTKAIALGMMAVLSSASVCRADFQYSETTAVTGGDGLIRSASRMAGGNVGPGITAYQVKGNFMRIEHVADAATPASDALDPVPPREAASPASAKNACSLLTVDELSTGLGSAYSKAEPSSNGDDEISCEYSPGEENIYPATLTISLKNGKTTMQTLRGVGTRMVRGTKAESDLGDASFYMPMDVGIYALKGDTLVSLQFGLSKGTREQKQALVRKVLSRL